MIRICLILYILIPWALYSQTFDTSFKIDGFGEVCTSVVLDGTSYYFVGACLDESSSDNNFLLQIYESDDFGNVTDSIIVDFDSLSYNTGYNRNSLIKDENSYLWLTGVLRDNSSLVQRRVILKLENFQSAIQVYYSPIIDSFEIASSLFLFNGKLYNIGASSNGANGLNDYYIAKLDTNLILQADTNIGGSDRELIGNAIQFEDKFVLSGLTSTNANMHPYYLTPASNAQFVCLDTSFNILWESTLVTSGADFAPMIQEHGFFYYTLEVPNSQGFRIDLRHVYGRLDLNNGDVLWMDTLELTDEITFPGYIESIDSTGFVIMCKVEKQGYPFDLTQIIKFNAIGEKEWERIYYSSDFTNNELNSMQVDDQGYLVFGGGYYSTITNSSDVWALKLGPDGCLSNSDCGILTGILDLTPAREEFSLKAFPNPAQELVQVIVENTGSNLNENLELRIYDLSGKLLFESMQKLHGQIPIFQIDIGDFLTGMYVVEACINGVTCGSTELIVK